MSLKEKIIEITQLADDFLSNDDSIASQDFIKLADKLMNLVDITSNLEKLE